jgi:hypothetical protein
MVLINENELSDEGSKKEMTMKGDKFVKLYSSIWSNLLVSSSSQAIAQANASNLLIPDQSKKVINNSKNTKDAKKKEPPIKRK